MKRKRLVSFVVFLTVLISTVSVYAKVIYRSGPNIVTSTEKMQYFYEGTIQLSSAHNDRGRSMIRGYIRYYIPDKNGRIIKDTGRVYTPYSLEDGRIVRTRTTFRDSLNPFAKKTRFVYNFEYIPYGSGRWPMNIPKSSFTEIVELGAEF